jgi:exopolysaccharide biosynthesis polyprenyl glycosylphosphotransferase
MRSDIFASPSDSVSGLFIQPAICSGTGHGFTPATATAAMTPAVDSPAETGSSSRATATAHAPVMASSNGHSGHHASNGSAHAHSATMLTSWSPAVASSSGAGTTAGSSTVLAAHLQPRGFYLRFGKRLFDVVGSALAILAHSPLLLLAAVAIRIESRGPVFYRSTRIGKNGRPFTFLKLRSMVDGADRTRHHVTHLNEADGPVFKIANDPRVTRVGRFLRVTSIDEIPQFINVLRGEMSLVGPRPPLPAEVAQYEPWQLRRLDVLPGITCLWQISGRSRIGFQEWMRLDLEYIKHRSLGLDLKILLRTIPAVLSRDGAY